ncbi:MAG: hypothetical protein ACKVOH_04130 [Chlamydiales bacterium]
MPKVKCKKEDITRCESEINNLWGELNTSIIAHPSRVEFEKRLGEIELEFKGVLNGQAPIAKLEQKLHKLDVELARAALKQAEAEISKSDLTSAVYQALENIRKSLDDNSITPITARHEIKNIIRKRG